MAEKSSAGLSTKRREVIQVNYGNYLIVYAKAEFKAQCGSNAMSTFYRQWTGDPAESFGEIEK